MRTTFAFDDVLAAVKEMAASGQKSLGEVISSLARQALRPVSSSLKTRNGVPLLPIRAGSQRVTLELVRQLEEELP